MIRYLLDTNVIIRSALNQNAVDPFDRWLSLPNAACVISHVSIWEMIIKQQIGRLDLHRSIAEVVQQIERCADLLPIELAHVIELKNLPLLHRDPFDRLLISQAQCEGLTLVTTDREILAYPIKTLMAA